jgi:hypothetical protein
MHPSTLIKARLYNIVKGYSSIAIQKNAYPQQFTFLFRSNRVTLKICEISGLEIVPAYHFLLTSTSITL